MFDGFKPSSKNYSEIYVWHKTSTFSQYMVYVLHFGYLSQRYQICKITMCLSIKHCLISLTDAT